MVHNRMTEEDVIRNNGAVMYGRVRQYANKDGYGFIHTEDKKDIFVSSYVLGKKEDKFRVGALVSFIPVMYEGKVVADEIKILEVFPSGDVLQLPNGKYLPVKRVTKYGYVGGKQVLEKIKQPESQMLEAGYTYDDLAYIFIRTSRGEFRFYNDGAKQRGDGQTDLKKFEKYLNTFFMSMI